MKAYWGVDVWIHIFLTSALVGGEWSASLPSRFTPGERAPDVHWIGDWGAPKPVWRGPRIYIPQKQGDPVTPPGTGLPSLRLLRLQSYGGGIRPRLHWGFGKNIINISNN
jgi:hypothetical protein